MIRQKLLESLGTEPDRGVRNKIGDAVAEVARQYSETGTENPRNNMSDVRLLITSIDERWTELLQALFQLAQAPEADKRETAYRVFATTPGIIGKEQEEAVILAFQKGFKDDAVKVRTLSIFFCQLDLKSKKRLGGEC